MSGSHGGAPWVRTRLRAAPLEALLTAALVLVAAFLAAALPRALDRGADQGLRELIRGSDPLAASVLMSAHPNGIWPPQPEKNAAPPTEEQLTSAAEQRRAELEHTAGAIAATAQPPLRLADGGPVYGVRTQPRPLPDAALPRPGGLPANMTLYYLNDVASQAHLSAGRWPTGVVTHHHYEVALSQSTAADLGVHVGSVLDAGPSGSPTNRGDTQVEVVGLFTADRPNTAFWAGSPCLAAACLTSTAQGNEAVPFWLAGAVVGSGELSSLLDWGYREDFYQLPIDPGDLHVYQLPAIQRAVNSLMAGPGNVRLSEATGRQQLRVSSPLPQLLSEASVHQAAVAPLTEVGPAGAAGVAAAVLCLAAALAAERRSVELRLLRARGGSRTGVLGRLIGEGAVTVLPASVAGTLLSLVLLPTPRWTASVLVGLAVAVVALLGFPLRAVLLSSGERPMGERRRLVVELAVLAVTVGAVVAVRRRGVTAGGDGVDLLLAGAPLLIALTGALILARVQPVLIGWVAGRAARRSGLVGFLGLARAARGDGRRRPSLLPLLALLLAVTTAGFGATVLDSVAAGRESAALAAVGVGARVSSTGTTVLPEGFESAAASLPGVGTATSARVEPIVPVGAPGDGLIPDMTVIVIDPAAYAAVTRELGAGGFDSALLADDGRADTPVPALVSADVAAQLGSGPGDVRFPAGKFKARVAGVINGTPAINLDGATKTMVVPSGPVTRRLPAVGRANVWIAIGQVRAAPLRDLLHRLSSAQPVDAAFSVRTTADTSQELAAEPLQRTAVALFWTSVAAAAGFALLSVLLTLVRAAPQRAALLARLRTMGLRPRQGLALILAEALPQSLVAATAGGLLAAVTVPLLGPAVDLTAMVGATGHIGLRVAVLPVLVQVLAFAALAAVAVVVEAVVSGRRQITTELRAGDER